MVPEVNPVLRRDWTTGACAAAGSRAAFAAVLTGRFRDPITIRLPRGGSATFPRALTELSGTGARAGIVKDASDDPDIRHGDLHSARSRLDVTWLAGILGEIGAEPTTLATARTATGAADVLGVAGELRETLARAIAGLAREVALATICGKTAVEVAIVDRLGSFLARVGG